MTDFFLRLFGIRTTGAQQVVDRSIDFYGLNPAYLLLVAVVLGAGVFWLYYRSAADLSGGRKFALGLLRSLFLLAILGVLLRPVIKVVVEQATRRTMVVLVDSSGSMGQIPDQRSDEKDLKRAAMLKKDGLDPTKGLNQPLPSSTIGLSQATRLELVKSALDHPKLELLPRLARDFDLSVYTFDRKVGEVSNAAYKGVEIAVDEPLGFWQEYWYLLPLVLLVAGLAAFGASFLVEMRWLRYTGLGGAGTAVVWLILAIVMGTSKPIERNQPVATETIAEIKSRLSTQWVAGLSAPGPQSAVGNAVRDVISRKRGQLAGVVLITDGASNAGVQPIDAARLAGQDKVPLYIYGVGVTSPKDIVVGKTLFAPELAFIKDEVQIGVRVRGMGMVGQTAQLTVAMGQERAQRDITFNSDGEQVVTVNLTPKTAGEQEIVATITPRDDELIKDNNSASQRIRVIDGKIKVLYIEQSPRWEFKYAQAALMRDRRVEFKCVLLEGDAALVNSENTPYLPEIPKKKEDLFKYDVVVFGDIDPRAFSPAQLEMLEEYVSKFGGAIIVVAGKRFTPSGYRKTLVEKMIPVELDATDVGTPQQANRAIRLELTAAGKTSPMLRLVEKETDNIQRWLQLPPIYWTAKISRAKPAADILVIDPDPVRASTSGKMPVVAIHQYGMGQVLFVGTDNLWRWRKNAGDKHHATIWGQMVYRMAMPRLLGAAKRTQLTTDQKEYTLGQPITIYARLYSEGFEPMREPTLKATVAEVGGANRTYEVALGATAEQHGMYRVQLTELPAGRYQFSVNHDPAVKLEFLVADPNVELAEPAMNELLLRKMASESGGEFFREEDLHTLPGKVAAKPKPKPSTLEAEVAFSPFYFLLLLGLVTAEWIVRKVSQLK